MQATLVLVLSEDALAAALVAALVEIEGLRVGFAHAGETSRDALRRLRPGTVFIDGDHPDARSAAFMGPAKMMGARVVLFGRQRGSALLREYARAHDAHFLLMPPAAGALLGVLSGSESLP